MDLKTLIDAQMELMGNDHPSGACGVHADTRKEAIKKGKPRF